MIDLVVFRVVIIRLKVYFFFKQKTAYEMRISDWSSDVCSSDLCFTAEDALSVDGGTGGVTGIQLADATDQTADFAADVAISANGGTATGVISTGASGAVQVNAHDGRSEEHTTELQSLMRSS